MFTSIMQKKIQEEKQNELRENSWIKNFHLMSSKDNEHFHKNLRELFDNPLNYDVNGSRM